MVSLHKSHDGTDGLERVAPDSSLVDARNSYNKSL